MNHESRVLQDMSDWGGRLEIEPLLMAARTARSDGHGWSRIGEALGLGADAGLFPADAAFELVTVLQRIKGGSFSWTCQDCGRDVTEDAHFQIFGGHTPDCSRLAAELAEDAARRIWDRAATDRGGPAPRLGDRHVAALLSLHAETLGSGTADSVGTLAMEELFAAYAAAGYFGLNDLAAVLAGLATKRDAVVDEPAARSLADAYAAVAVGPGPLYTLFRDRLRTTPEDFAPPGP